MEDMLKQETEEKAQKAIAVVLRYGSILSAVVMAFGIGVAFFRGGPPTPTVRLSPAALLTRALALDPLAITELGILLLLLTPVFRVVIAVIAFGLERDTKYTLISSGVLLVVLASIIFALE